jgi:hypothetical protein
LKPSPSFERPAGLVNNVVRTPDGRYVVPLVPAGRVQLYDARWRFLRGWQVEAFGGDFGVEYTANRTVEVITARRSQHYTFTDAGVLISGHPIPHPDPGIVRKMQAAGSSYAVPTPPWLLVFSSPFLCWGMAAVGGAGVYLAKRNSANREA